MQHHDSCYQGHIAQSSPTEHIICETSLGVAGREVGSLKYV